MVLRGLRLFKDVDFRNPLYALRLVLRIIPFLVPLRAFLRPAAIRFRNAVFAAPFSLAIKVPNLLILYTSSSNSNHMTLRQLYW